MKFAAVAGIVGVDSVPLPMPLQRDDADERIARLEKMMEEARAKPADPAGEAKASPESVQANAKTTRQVARPGRSKNAGRP